MADPEDGGYWQARSRRLSRRRLLAGGAVTSAGVLLAACSGGKANTNSGSSAPPAGGQSSAGTASTGTPKPGGIWRQATITQAPHFSPYHPGADPSFVNSWRREFGYYERLWDSKQTADEKKNNTYHVVQRLAASSEQVDETTVVVKLKPSNFHNKPPVNGRPVTAQDIVANVEFLTKPPATGGAFIQGGKDLKSVTAVDDQTVRFETFGPRALFFEEVGAVLLAVPKDMLDEQTLKTQTPVGSGPFVFKSNQQGSREEAERNPDYYVKDRPFIQGKVLTFVPDSAAIEA
ncbi:MAG: ABC transporter substrate-binding protein, partial [Dehalococcoidia bacterium]